LDTDAALEQKRQRRKALRKARRKAPDDKLRQRKLARRYLKRGLARIVRQRKYTKPRGFRHSHPVEVPEQVVKALNPPETPVADKIIENGGSVKSHVDISNRYTRWQPITWFPQPFPLMPNGRGPTVLGFCADTGPGTICELQARAA
jgi:hypothetical protein